MTNVRLKLSPPWVTFLHEIEALFDGDPQIAINYDDENHKIVLATNNGDKATALQKILPSERKFGNVTVKVEIDGTFSNRAFVSNEELFNVVFDKNPAFAFCKQIEGIITAFTYVVFKNTVVQFFNDNLNDIYGNVSTLYEDIARDILVEIPAVVYNTDVERKVGMPLGEWP